jgi:hypothetical protein
LIVPDLNLLIYAYDQDSEFHSRAQLWWTNLVNGEETVCLPWAVTLGFLRITTSHRIMANPWPIESAIRTVGAWFDYRAIRPIDPGGAHLRLVSELLEPIGVGAKLVTDAHLAALAIENRAVLHTHDRDFERFIGVRIFDPL